ncbi:hypothetical protein ACE6H2_015673 [Prunus campanulata]
MCCQNVAALFFNFFRLLLLYAATPSCPEKALLSSTSFFLVHRLCMHQTLCKPTDFFCLFLFQSSLDPEVSVPLDREGES